LVVDLIGGSWTGLISVTETATNVFLHADDGNGHTGDSTSFNAIAGPAILVSMPESAYESSPGFVGQGRVTIPQPVGSNLTFNLVRHKQSQGAWRRIYLSRSNFVRLQYHHQ